MAYKSVLGNIIPERSTALLSGVIKDENGAVVPSTDLDTFTLTLYDKASETDINSRTDVNILNANGGTVDANGNFTFLLTPDDNQIKNDALDAEDHIALFEYTWGGGVKAGRHEIHITVKNFEKVP